MAPKRPHKTLQLSEKQTILEQLASGASGKVLAEKYGVGTSTISDIKRNKKKIEGYILRCISTSTPARKKTVRNPGYPLMENELYRWLLTQRQRQVTISSSILREKAVQIYTKHYGDNKFIGSRGWFRGFKERYGIRHLKVNGKKLSSDATVVAPAIESLESESDLDEDLPLSLLRERLHSTNLEHQDMIQIGNMLQETKTNKSQYTEVSEWITGDDKTVPLEVILDEEVVTKNNSKVKHEEAISSFSTCIQWAEENGVELAVLSTLRMLRERAMEAKQAGFQRSFL